LIILIMFGDFWWKQNFIWSLPSFNFPEHKYFLCYSSQCLVHFSKEVLDWCKGIVHTLQALLRNFLLINNFALRSLVLHRFYLRCVFFSFSGMGSLSLHRIWVK
jgi:hypothetical protein